MDDRARRWLAEAVIGLGIALLLMLVAASTGASLHFVYQGF
jgi:hypothetical protein